MFKVPYLAHGMGEGQIAITTPISDMFRDILWLLARFLSSNFVHSAFVKYFFLNPNFPYPAIFLTNKIKDRDQRLQLQQSIAKQTQTHDMSLLGNNSKVQNLFPSGFLKSDFGVKFWMFAKKTMDIK